MKTEVVEEPKEVKAPEVIKVSEVVWALGDPEESIHNGVAVVQRPIYYKGLRVGMVHRDYASALIEKLSA